VTRRVSPGSIPLLLSSGTGDHCHIGDHERPYPFTTVDRLIDDFFREVDRWDRQS
jgi:hypothetical protein